MIRLTFARYARLILGFETEKKLGEERRRHEEQLHRVETGRLKKETQKMESARGN